MSEYVSAFFTVPSRILDLPNISLAYLRIYETIFQFLNHGKPCFLSNDMIKERTGITSNSTISDAFKFFELHGELKRVLRDGKRYFVQPSRHIGAEDDQPVDNPLAVARPPSRCSETPPLGTARHKINNLNLKNINKSSCSSNDKKIDNQKKEASGAKTAPVDLHARKKENEKKHEWAKKSETGPIQCAKFWGPGHPDYDRIEKESKAR